MSIAAAPRTHTATGSAPLLLESVSKRFGDTLAVDGVSFTLGAHEVLAVVGPSGCGKSTLLRMVAGLLPPDSGQVVLGGRLVDDGAFHLPPERRRVGLVFQDHSLFPHLTVADNVGFGVRGGSRAERARRVEQMLDVVSLHGLGSRYPHELSGGQRQRVAVARALAPGPDLVLLDEPFANLDHNLRLQVRAEVLAALRATGVPAVLVTHDQREALAIGDRIGVMRAGRLVQLDRPEVVFHQPVDRFVGAFLGEASFLPVHQADDGSAATELGPVDGVTAASAVADRRLAMVRPDDLTFRADPHGDAEVVAADYQGAGWLYRVRLPSAALVAVEADHLAAFGIGTRGTLTLTPGHQQVAVGDG